MFKLSVARMEEDQRHHANLKYYFPLTSHCLPRIFYVETGNSLFLA